MPDSKAARSGRRAAPLPPQERREALILAAIGVIRERHTLPTTREIAEAAGVAEGTIFRVFANKHEFFDAVIDRTFDSRALHHELEKIDGGAGLERVMIECVGLLQARFQEIFDIMGAFSMIGPPERYRDPQRQKRQEAEIGSCVLQLIDPYADQLRLPVPEVVRLMRLLTFSGSHIHVNDGRVLTPQEIVHAVLYGVVKREDLKTEQVRGK